MRVEVEPGKHVVAVSGGVDSVVLLDLLSKQNNLELIVAHFDHGIRKDSSKDAEFVSNLTQKYDLKFEVAKGKLGPKASEESAREARYKFLNEIRKKHGALAIITAHHQDDLIETAILNVLRGTGRKGLTALSSRAELVRPLLGYEKADLLAYAKSHDLKWREDPTNEDEKYLRNFIRAHIVPKLTHSDRADLLKIILSQQQTNKQIDIQIANILHFVGVDENFSQIERLKFINLPYSLALEVLATWLRQKQISFDRKSLERLSVQLKTKPPSARLDVSRKWQFLVSEKQISLIGPN